MEYSFILKGHPNVTSRHKTTLEFTKDPEIGLKADCIVGVGSGVSMENFPTGMIDAIQDENTKITVKLETENAKDEIHGFGHPDLTLDHPTDMVVRKSEFKCSRTLMINADKAACDLKLKLVRDLADSKQLKVTIIVG
ncbi:protein of unknown function DUF371 [Methanobacterium lacus]|jgi:uncharacterized protein|uniref:DUF371 domain-containing protein n=1 Tax=Methanobacterium lacus (strain AL-21) TaxID=877455 RepID=F0TBW7_METLA|nr:DUF371 domain-containing protein [Methanobacterium lacus]ADZ10309.1 protein of unknown function DUF371 [Methanobacterium lacus]